MTDKHMEVMTLKLPKPLKAQLENKAKSEGTSKSEIVRHALRRYLEDHPPAILM